MNWAQIEEPHKSEFVEIGNHSHSHEYLVEENADVIKKDILKSIEIFENKLGSNSIFFFTLLGNTVLNLKKLFRILVLSMLLDSIQVLLTRQKICLNYQGFQSMRNMVRSKDLVL